MKAPSHIAVPGPTAASPEPAVRLDLQADVWETEDETLLDCIGLEPGTTCLDLGCGAAGILGPLSRHAGRAGHVTGVDGDALQAAAARRYVEQRGLSNVDVLRRDPFATGLPRATFDLVHARFLLAATGRDGDLLREMVALARPGSVVAVQEPDAAIWPCYPPRPAWDRLTAAVATALAQRGGDLGAGRRTYRLLRRAGLEDVRVRAAVIALQDGHPAMRLPILLAEALRRPIVDGKLLSEDNLDAALRDCEQGVLDGDTFATTFLVTQVWGRKPSSQQP